jgi:predicted Fe-S protein YdhL (DUF1289 family)
VTARRGGALHCLPRRENYLEAMPPIESPCVNICALEPASDICLGCGRSLAEIARWSRYSDAERAEIMASLPARLAAFALPATEKSGA